MWRGQYRRQLGLCLLFVGFVTPAHADLIVTTGKTAIKVSGQLSHPTGTQTTLTLDVNRDGVPDLFFDHYPGYSTGMIMPWSEDTVKGLNGTTILLDSTYAAALSPGDTVGPSSGTFSETDKYVGVVNTFTSPAYNKEFLNPERSLGVKIPVGGQDHFAWVFVQSVGNFDSYPEGNSLVIGGTGYETTANAPAVITTAPEPAGLIPLCAAVSVFASRRRRSRRVAQS